MTYNELKETAKKAIDIYGGWFEDILETTCSGCIGKAFLFTLSRHGEKTIAGFYHYSEITWPDIGESDANLTRLWTTKDCMEFDIEPDLLLFGVLGVSEFSSTRRHMQFAITPSTDRAEEKEAESDE